MQPSNRERASGDIASRIAKRIDGARLRVLIIGAGIAGATLGALLRQRGELPAIIEKGGELDGEGYMLGLLPLGGRVLNGLGLVAAYQSASVPVSTYALYDRHGRKIRSYRLGGLIDRYGVWRGIERGALIELLRGAAGTIDYGTSVSKIRNTATATLVTFNDGSSAEFDLVVGADGIHSSTRSLILKPNDVQGYDTGWGGFVAWSSLHDQKIDVYREMWSSGWRVGLYPVKDRLGMFLAGAHRMLAERDVDSYANEIEARLPDGPFARAVRMRDRSAGSFYWRMADCRTRIWRRGRTVLLGDAAAAFLPTAGVGASLAMDSAAALADELSRADVSHLDYALELYEKRQRRRVELAQANSRSLSRFMFVNSRPAAWLRDQLMRVYTLKMLVRDISRVMSGYR